MANNIINGDNKNNNDIDNTESDNLKIVCIGDYGVGKTTLMMTALDGKYPFGEEIYIPTVLDSLVYPVNYKKRIVNITWLDTGGGDHFNDLRPTLYPNSDVIVICFSQSSRNSYSNCKNVWIEELKNHIPNVPVVLVQTKIDSINIPHIQDKSSFITHKEGIQMSKNINAAAYFECSSILNQGLDNLFKNLVKIGLDHKKHNGGSGDSVKKSNCIIL